MRHKPIYHNTIKDKAIKLQVKGVTVRLSQMCCPINTSTSPTYTSVIYATNVLLKYFRFPPPNYVCVSTSGSAK